MSQGLISYSITKSVIGSKLHDPDVARRHLSWRGDLHPGDLGHVGVPGFFAQAIRLDPQCDGLKEDLARLSVADVDLRPRIARLVERFANPLQLPAYDHRALVDIGRFDLCRQAVIDEQRSKQGPDEKPADGQVTDASRCHRDTSRRNVSPSADCFTSAALSSHGGASVAAAASGAGEGPKGAWERFPGPSSPTSSRSRFRDDGPAVRCRTAAR